MWYWCLTLDFGDVTCHQRQNFVNSRAARYPKAIHINQEFNVNQDLKGVIFGGQFVHQATVDVSGLGDIRTLKIEPKHGISGIYAR